MKMRASEKNAILQLAAFFRRNGHVRRQNVERLNIEGTQAYKKGNEVRLVANSQDELLEIQRFLEVLGFTAGRPHAQGRKFRVPIYRKEQVERFLSLIGESSD